MTRNSHFLGAKLRTLRKEHRITLDDLSVRCSQLDPKCAPSLTDVPTAGETLPAYRAGSGLWAVVTRAGTPPAVLAKLNADIVKALQTPDVRARLAQADIEIVGSTPAQCDAFLREQTAVWGAIVKASGARVD